MVIFGQRNDNCFFFSSVNYTLQLSKIDILNKEKSRHSLVCQRVLSCRCLFCKFIVVYVQCSTAPSRSVPLFLVDCVALSLASQIVEALIWLAIERPEGWLVVSNSRQSCMRRIQRWLG